jgi:hypothetical protein
LAARVRALQRSAARLAAVMSAATASSGGAPAFAFALPPAHVLSSPPASPPRLHGASAAAPSSRGRAPSPSCSAAASCGAGSAASSAASPLLRTPTSGAGAARGAHDNAASPLALARALSDVTNASRLSHAPTPTASPASWCAHLALIRARSAHSRNCSHR